MQTKTLTFADLCHLEPRLSSLAAEVRAVRDDGEMPYFCADEAWRPFRRRLRFLVGWDAGREEAPRVPGLESLASCLARMLERLATQPPPRVDERLLTCEAYDAAYSTLYNLLPDCRDCGCMDSAALLVNLSIGE